MAAPKGAVFLAGCLLSAKIQKVILKLHQFTNACKHDIFNSLVDYCQRTSLHIYQATILSTVVATSIESGSLPKTPDSLIC